jgi:enoyl-CoA hydratase/carnithine racemase
MNDLRVERDPPLVRVLLDRPAKHNAVTSAMWQALPALVSEIEGDIDVRVVLLRGAGDAAFSAGADIGEMQAALRVPDELERMQRAVQTGQAAWAAMDRPTIAVIRGVCAGGGCGLALASDLRLATPDSTFAIPPARLGLVYSLADTRRLVDAVGPAFAKEMLFTGRTVPADEALQRGLVHRLVTADQIDVSAQALALDVAQSAQSSVRAAKRLVNAIAAGARAETAESRELYDASFSSADFQEGARAFLEKRSPKF